MRLMVLLLLVFVGMIPSLSSADSTIENVLLDKTFWEQYDWGNVGKSDIYKNNEWTQQDFKLDPNIRLYQLKGGVTFDGKKVSFSMDKNKTDSSISFSVGVIDDVGDRSFEDWRKLLVARLGKVMVCYDGSEKGVNFYNKCQWDVGNTLIALSSFIEHGNVLDISTLSISYEKSASAVKVKPNVYLSCVINGDVFDFLIDGNSRKIKKLDLQVLDWKVFTSENLYSIEMDNDMSIDINRINGKVTGRIKYKGEYSKLSGQCEKLNTSEKKF